MPLAIYVSRWKYRSSGMYNINVRIADSLDGSCGLGEIEEEIGVEKWLFEGSFKTWWIQGKF